MAIVVEDGTGKSDAETYASVSDADSYADGIGNPNSWLSTSAHAYLRMAANPADAETVTINGKAYTFESSLTDVDGNVAIGADLEETLDRLNKALDLSGIAGTDYAASMTAHSTVKSKELGADYVAVQSKAFGSASNSFAVSETFADPGNRWESSTFVGGVDGKGTAEKEQRLRKAARFLDGTFGGRFVGAKSAKENALEWPRSFAVDVNGFAVDADSVPAAIKNACAELAISSYDETDGELAPNVDDQRGVKRSRVKAAVIEEEKEFFGGDPEGMPKKYLRAEHLLRPYLRPKGELVRA